MSKKKINWKEVKERIVDELPIVGIILLAAVLCAGWTIAGAYFGWL